MYDRMKGRQIESIWWPDNDTESGRHIKAEGTHTLQLEYIYGEDDSWVLQLENGIEVARHNVRYIETIIWK